jgi:hypothetical protein
VVGRPTAKRPCLKQSSRRIAAGGLTKQRTPHMSRSGLREPIWTTGAAGPHGFFRSASRRCKGRCGAARTARLALQPDLAGSLFGARERLSELPANTQRLARNVPTVRGGAWRAAIDAEDLRDAEGFDDYEERSERLLELYNEHVDLVEDLVLRANAGDDLSLRPRARNARSFVSARRRGRDGDVRADHGTEVADDPARVSRGRTHGASVRGVRGVSSPLASTATSVSRGPATRTRESARGQPSAGTAPSPAGKWAKADFRATATEHELEGVREGDNRQVVSRGYGLGQVSTANRAAKGGVG